MKRDKVPFDRAHFEKLRNAGKSLSTRETFQEIYKTNHWSGDASISGARIRLFSNGTYRSRNAQIIERV